MVILECFKLASYYKSEYRFSYLCTKDDAEIDLVVERPGKPVLFIEIKSSKQVTEESLRTLISLSKDFGNCEAVCLSNEPHEKLINGVKIMPWNKGIKRFFFAH
jgi:predicted AAA+ superfamily ATPase